ncbi:MAG: DctP family TRAP transporter solute-binding subunit [Armatimonadota bacterium]
MPCLSRRSLLLAASAAALPGCAGRATDGRRVLRVAHDNPTSHPVHLGLERAAAVLQEASGGRLELQVFPASQLGTQQEELLATVVGSLDLYVTAVSWLGQYYAPISVLDSPFVFRDLAHMYRAYESPIGQRLLEGVRTRVGARIVDTWYYGRRHLTLVKGPVRTPEELKGVKMRAAAAPIYIETVRALGADPTPMSLGEVYLALKTGVIDGQENPLPTIEAMKFQEAAPYLVLTGHMITPVSVIANDRRWSRLPESERALVQDAILKGREVNNAAIQKQEHDLLVRFRGEGVTIVEPDVEAFRRAARAVATRFESDWGRGTYEELQSLGETR